MVLGALHQASDLLFGLMVWPYEWLFGWRLWH